MQLRRLLGVAAGSVALLAAASIDATAYLAHIRFLASPELKGRRTGTPELLRAADYIAGEFKKAGLSPAAPGYFQDYEVTVTSGVGPGGRATWRVNGTSERFEEGRETVPLSLSANGSASGGVVFAGYGITAPEYKYDDYEGVDAKGKIVLVLRHEPQENDEKSAFEGKRLTSHSQLANKLINARRHGAAAVLVVNDAPNHAGEPDELERFVGGVGREDAGIPARQVTASAAARLLASASGDLAALSAAIDRDLRPQSFALTPGLRFDFAVNVLTEKRTTRNVAGFLPGETDEYVVLGGHFDHLGLGEQHSLAPAQAGTVHPGADDNASGTAGVIELARQLASQPRARRGYLFLAFSGEEEGVLGSAWYVAHPLKPLANAVAMINLDMIGRIQDGKVFLSGGGTGSSFKTLVERAAIPDGLKIEQSDAGGYGGSDHTSFTSQKVPTLFFFSGLHSDYHKPSDTWDKINAKDAVKLLGLVTDLSTTLASAPDRPQFVRVEEAPKGMSTGGYGAYFGSVPDFGGEANTGARFSDVRDGSPAGKAGLKGGDTLVEFDGQPIRNLYDMTYALQQRRPGDVVKVKVIRDGKPLEATVTLSKRN